MPDMDADLDKGIILPRISDTKVKAWEKVRIPDIWRPIGPDRLEGYYGGRSLKNGQHGQYEVVLIHTPGGKSYLISGTIIIQLLDAANVQKGDPVLIYYRGTEDTKAGRTVKKFDLYVDAERNKPAGENTEQQ